MIIQRLSGVIFSNQTSSIAFEEILSYTQEKPKKALGLFSGLSIINRKIPSL